MNFNKDNEQKLVKRQNKKCYDKILLMFLSFPTRGSPLLLEPLILIAIVTQASGSFLDLCHGQTSNWLMSKESNKFIIFLVSNSIDL